MEHEFAPSSSSASSLLISDVVSSGIDEVPEEDGGVVSPSPSPSPDKGRNVSASSQSPRLASLTGLLMNQKAPKWNSTSSDSSSSTKSPTTPDADQTPVPVRTLRFDENPTELQTSGSFGSLNGAPRRTTGATAVSTASVTNSEKSPSGITETDLRRFVFNHSRAKRLISGLRVHAFTRQAFVSSFTVGLALGSIVAIVLKILNDVTYRMLYS